jgi:hypothetical protein
LIVEAGLGPLPPRAAALVGHSMLGIHQIDRQLHGIREYP